MATSVPVHHRIHRATETTTKGGHNATTQEHIIESTLGNNLMVREMGSSIFLLTDEELEAVNEETA